ncbi:uncharacterized membrane protein At1g16860-like isoform X2 [Cynara cardunculus var. scolymus]|uniref:uncharacterized membrane protein At1g16860-like isoform X2 n=1 Tax=Cynara cardunculus var. scolymus TaxID=59895 RepID=UPI000D6234B5|nr:uncharacterized membrane protein At1g16860-like isoform X2 [Cynara cardunculus var. scolymus]
MGSRIPSHQLSNGLYVSGRPEQLKDRQPTIGSRAIPYTGGDVNKSGELGKMFDIPVAEHPPPVLKPHRASSSSQQSSGSLRSGPVSKRASGSGPIVALQPTGLITSGQLELSGGRRSGQLEPTAAAISSGKTVYGSSVTTLGYDDVRLGFRKLMWVLLVMAVMGLMVGAFLTVAVKKPVILVAAAAVLVPAMILILWNCVWKKRGLLAFFRKYPNAELRGAIDGQFVKVTGKYVADFYISDFQSGLRALVKAGYGAKVAPFVKETTVVDISKENRELSPTFLRWLADRSLSSDDRVMRLKEGYIKEGSTVSVMGVVRRHENVLMIVPPTEPMSTGCRWGCGLLPTYVEGLVLTCDENQNADVIPV